MGIGANWRAKWDALRVKMAGQPKLELVKPKHRTSGPTPVLPRNWHEPAQQERLFGLAVCRSCHLAQLPGEPLRNGLCGPCEMASASDATPPAA